MKKIAFAWLMGAGLLLAACGGKVFVDLPTGASGSGAGGSGGIPNVGGAGGITDIGGAGGWVDVGGGVPCVTCGEAITTEEEDVLCPGLSQNIYDALTACICQGACAPQCGMSCMGPPGVPLPNDCLVCIQDASANGCGFELAECANDI